MRERRWIMNTKIARPPGRIANSRKSERERETMIHEPKGQTNIPNGAKKRFG